MAAESSELWGQLSLHCDVCSDDVVSTVLIEWIISSEEGPLSLAHRRRFGVLSVFWCSKEGLLTGGRLRGLARGDIDARVFGVTLLGW